MEELNLKVGASLNLELFLAPVNPRCDVELIGYRRGHSLLVTMPDRPAVAAAIYQGCECVLRYLSGTRVEGFRSQVLTIAAYPYRYLHLRYPESVDRVVVRRAERVKVHLPAKVRHDAPVATAAAVMDLSDGGALVLCQKLVGDVGDQVVLEFGVDFAGAHHLLELPAVIRNQGRRIADDPDAGGYFGLEFEQLRSDQKVILAGFIFERLARKG